MSISRPAGSVIRLDRSRIRTWMSELIALPLPSSPLLKTIARVLKPYAASRGFNFNPVEEILPVVYA